MAVTKRLITHLVSTEDGGKSTPFVKRLSPDFSASSLTGVQVETPDGGISTDPTVVMNQLVNIFSNWLAARKGDLPSPPPSLQGQYIPPAEKFSVVNLVVMKDFMGVLKHSSGDTCPGPSGISFPLISLLPDEALEALVDIFNHCLALGALPQQWLDGYIYPIPKKGSFTIDNSRPISLLEAPLKLLTKLISDRLHEHLPPDYYAPSQFGFRRGHSATDAFHTLLGAVEDAAERDLPLHLCLVDITKAFDSISPQSLAQAYQRAGLDQASVNFLSSMDGTGTARVLTPFGPTKSFNVEWELGKVRFSPLLSSSCG
jgi:hypothetical protein